MLILLLVFSTNAACVTIISHKDVKESSLTSSELRRIFSMRQTRWPDNTAIIVFTLSSQHPVHESFAKNDLKVFPYQLDLIWNKLTFSGLGVPPQKMATQRELIRAVKNTPGSIGYLDDSKEVSDVRIINIEK